PDIIGQQEYERLWERASMSIDTALRPGFLRREWEQVILAQSIGDLDGYLACERKGRGRAIGESVRRQAWTAISSVLSALRARDQRTHHQVAEDAATILAERGGSLYRHVLVDEGQDLHPTQWRLLRRAVGRGANDLFIVSDPHQRIYDNKVSLAAVGIEVRGRSSKLTINYRTTQEILSWSVRMLDGAAADGLDDTADTLAGYRSPIHGRKPVLRTFGDWTAEVDGVVDQVRGWLDAGVEPNAVAVTARTKARVRDIKLALTQAGLPTVAVETMHSMKGMEFRCVAVTGLDEHTMPPQAALTPALEDPAARDQDLQRERCLLFVASTRARDDLVLSHSGTPSLFLVSGRR
ncbi:MAG: UvrD-helicase domain-containing protein, partial [Actinomycetota bacterium]|nr:UvrD-helicase domain-containing protein [Actinomycetota bacterium]